jgi:hypothetical protein
MNNSLSKGCHLDVVGGPSTPHDPESDAGKVKVREGIKNNPRRRELR